MCVPLFIFAPGKNHMWLNDPLRTLKLYQGRKSFFMLLYHALHVFGCDNSRVCQHPTVLSHWAFHLSLLSGLGLFLLPVLLDYDLCLELSTMVPWVISVGLRGTGRHAVYFIESQTLLTFGYWTFHLLKRLGVSQIMPINPSYWASGLLRPQSVICGARWRTLVPVI